MNTTTKADILARIEAERERWHQLLAKIPLSACGILILSTSLASP